MKTKRLWSGILIVVLLVFTHSVSSAAVPRIINYQGYLTDSNGQPVNGTVQLIFALYPTATSGSVIWSELHLGVTVTNGDYSVVLGSIDPVGNPLSLAFDDPYWLGISVNNGPEKMPREALASVPYALGAAYALSADNATTLEGQYAWSFAQAAHTHTLSDISTGIPISLANHGHFGAAWSGNTTGVGGYGLYVNNTSTTGYGGYFTGATSGVYGAGSNTGVYGAGSSNGVSGNSETGTGVYGWSISGYGVRATSISGSGVYGSSANGDGVVGSSSSGYGLHSLSNAKVDGNLTVGGTIKSTATRSIVFGPADLQYQPGVTAVRYSGGEYSYLTSASYPGNYALIPLTVIPDGSTISALQCTVTDNSTSTIMAFSVWECITTGTCSLKTNWCYSNSASGCPSNVSYASATPIALNAPMTAFVVDKANKYYNISIYTGNAACGANCKFHSCKVTYHE